MVFEYFTWLLLCRQKIIRYRTVRRSFYTYETGTLYPYQWSIPLWLWYTITSNCYQNTAVQYETSTPVTIRACVMCFETLNRIARTCFGNRNMVRKYNGRQWRTRQFSMWGGGVYTKLYMRCKQRFLLFFGMFVQCYNTAT